MENKKPFELNNWGTYLSENPCSNYHSQGELVQIVEGGGTRVRVCEKR